MPQDILTTHNITKTYKMGEIDVNALRGVSMSLKSSELIVLLGVSGSGKSTLLNIIGGLDVPTSGNVHYKDQDITSANETELTKYRRNNIGFVFQFYNLIPSLTAKENVALVTEIATNPLKAEEALELVGLQDRINHFPSQMSGGEQQRVAIARAIAKQPNILLCDEPTGALDFQTGVKVLEVIERINKEMGTTTAVITHNAPISAMAHRVITMADGMIQEETINKKIIKAAEISW